MSYVIVRVGGKQYRVEKGDSIVVDRMRAGEGDKVDLEPLMYADGDKSLLDPGELGRIKVKATVTGHERGKKIHGLKFKPKRGYKRRYGAPRGPHAPGDRRDQGRRRALGQEAGGRGWLIRRVLDRAETAVTRTPSASV